MQLETNKRNKKTTCKCNKIQFQAYPCCSKIVAESSHVANTCLHNISYGSEFLPIVGPTETFLHSTSYGAREVSELTKVLLLDTAVFIT